MYLFFTGTHYDVLIPKPSANTDGRSLQMLDSAAPNKIHSVEEDDSAESYDFGAAAWQDGDGDMVSVDTCSG
jgi:hypothetical protein